MAKRIALKDSACERDRPVFVREKCRVQLRA